ncbi:unnamed protein product [Schistocephalus solidus]|uniref:BTB domain-containing protein n=1 Tax=Schistocephalus solidus TaxID=70667 RepID=A0A183T9T3_SCHSO|nr:unnamed protein product [Schistocephalus solidus]
MNDVSEASLNHIRQLHAKLYEFYKAEQMTDVTITCAADSTPVRTHAFVCATSGYLADLLAGASGPPYVLALPSMGADRLRVLLDFLYSASLDPTISLTTYLQLASELKVPLLLEACQHALNQKIQTFGFNLESVDAGTTADDIRTIYAFILTYFSEGKLREQMINFFAAHPFAFTCRFFPPVPLPAFALAAECLRLIPVDVFTRLLEEGCLLMCDPEGVVSLGRQYGEQCSKYVLRYSLISSRTVTYEKFPAHSWKISGLRAYVALSWDNIRPLAGFDVTYENIWTGETQEVLWDVDRDAEQYTRQVLEYFSVPPGDVIEDMHIRHGWLIDQVTFVTRGGVHLGPCGLSMGGSVSELHMKDRSSSSTVPSPRYELLSRLDSSEDYSDDSDYEADSPQPVTSTGDLAQVAESKPEAPVLTALHGFCYSTIVSHGMKFWNSVKVCYSCIDPLVFRSKLPILPSSASMSDLHFSF